MNKQGQKTERNQSVYRLSKGEASRSCLSESKLFMASSITESPVLPENLMERVVARENIEKALRRVKSNKGSPGVDGMTVSALVTYVKENEESLKCLLLSGHYNPLPLKRVEIPKSGGGNRKLSIPSVRDRLVQQMIQQVLSPLWDNSFSESSFGFRPNRSAHQAVVCAQTYYREGFEWVVDIDLEKFFDTVNHDRLLARLADRIKDKRILKLIRKFVRVGIMENGLAGPPQDEGTPQGGPLSPLLSNIVLDELDKELERRGHRFVRYADDCNIYVGSERAGYRVFQSLKRFIEKKLRLKVNNDKSAVSKPSQRKFLGFSFTGTRTKKIRISSESLQRFRWRIKQLTKRSRGISLEELITQLKVYLRGWYNYFRLCETPSVLEILDGWIRRRLRCFIWKQWKRGKTRFRELRNRGLNREQASMGASSHHGPWRMSKTLAMSLAFRIRDFDAMGHFRLSSGRT